MTVPLLDWVDRGNDDHLLRKKYGDKSWFDAHMDSLDDFRKKLIEDYGFADLQTAYKNVVFTLTSSEDPQRSFGLKGSLLKLNAGRDDLLPRFSSHTTEVSRVENTDNMETTVTQANHIRMIFSVGDEMLGVKCRGQDAFADEEEDGLAAMLDDDLNMG